MRLSSTPILSPILILAMSAPLAAAAGFMVAVVPTLARQAANRCVEHVCMCMYMRMYMNRHVYVYEYVYVF